MTIIVQVFNKKIMKILSFIYLSVLCLLAIYFSDKDVDYNPKSLKTEIQKIAENNEAKKEEIFIDDSINERYKIRGKYFKLIKTDNIIAYFYIGRVNSCRANGCNSNRIQTLSETSEFFDYYVIFDTTKKIKNVNVYNYEATHGQEITVKKWLKQFIGYDGENNLVVGKNIDAISGATISVNGIVNDLQEKTYILRNLL